MINKRRHLQSQSLEGPAARRFWIDMALFQLNLLWMANWVPHSPILFSLTLLTSVVYLLWSWNLTGPRRHRTARLLLGVSTIVSVVPAWFAPELRATTVFLQVALLAAAGVFAAQASHIVAGRVKS